MNKNCIKLISFNLSSGMYKDIIDKIIDLGITGTPSFICIANAHMTVTAFRDKDYASIIKEAEIVTPDGMPLTWALRLLYGIKQERIAGMDILPDLIRRASLLNMPVFFYGSTYEMLKQTNSYLKANYPSLIIAGTYSPPFRKLTQEEEIQVTKMIRSSGAKMVFVVLGCPKQEKWMHSMKNNITATMIGIGGALPVFIGLQKRAPLWMQNSGLEWFYRLCKEPRRLLKRYLFTNILFISLLIREFILIRLLKKTTFE